MQIRNQVNIVARQMIGALPLRDGSMATVESMRAIAEGCDVQTLQALRREIGLIKAEPGQKLKRAVACQVIDGEIMKQTAPEGVEIMGLENPGAVHDAIAEAVGEARRNASKISNVTKEYAFTILAAYRKALIAFYFSGNQKAPTMFKTAVKDALVKTASAEIAFMTDDRREASRALWEAISYMKGVERYGALELGETIASIESIRKELAD